MALYYAKTDQIAEVICTERLRLSNLFLEAIQRLTALHAAQTQAVIERDADFARFDILLQMAREHKDRAKYALMEHIEQHRC